MTLFQHMEDNYGLILTNDELAQIIRIAVKEVDTFPANKCRYCDTDTTYYTVAVHCKRCATTIETGGIL